MKRFTETTKWRDSWFRRLSPLHKCLWQFVCDECDPAGVFEFDPELATFCIGEKIMLADLQELGERIEKLPSGKWLIKRFLEFQYTTLSQSCPAHKVVFAALDRHRLNYPKNTLLNSLSDREQDTDKDKATDKDKETEKGRVKRGEPAPTIEDAQGYAAGAPVIIAPECVAAWHDDRSRADWHFPKAGQMVEVRDWRADLRSYARTWQRNEQAGGGKPGGSNGRTPPKPESAWSIKQRLEAARETKAEIMGVNTYKYLSDKKREKVDALNESIRRLKEALAKCPDENS